MDEVKDTDEIESRHEARVTFTLLQAARAYRVRSGKLLGRIGLHPGQDALLKLLEDGEKTMGEAAARLSIQPPTVTKMVNRLAATGLVETKVVDGDRRKVAVRITEAAAGKIAQIEAIWRQLEEEALDGAEPDMLRDGLGTIARNLSRQNGSRGNGGGPVST